MTRRELNALCREHGLSTRGSKADLVASLAGTLSAKSAAAAAASEKVVELVVVKGCLKHSGDGQSNVSLGAAKKVTFIFKEKEEAGEALVAAQVNRRGRRRERVETGARKRVDTVGVSTDGNAGGVVCPDARVTRSRTNTMNLREGSGVERHNNIVEEETEMIGATIDIKQRIQETSNRVSASAEAGVSRRSTMKSSSCTAADTRIQSQNDPAEEEGELIGEVGRTKLKRRTAGKHKVGETLPAAAVSGRGRQHKCTEERGRSNSSAESVTGEVDGDAQETRSKKNVGNLHAGSGVERRDILAEAGGEGGVVRKAVDTKRKRKAPQNAENVAANTPAGISRRSTRSTSLSADDVMLCSIVEKKRGRRKAGDCRYELYVDKKAAEVQDFATSELPESKRSQREEYCKLNVQKSAQVAVSGRVAISCSVNVAVALPTVIENKRNRKTETVHQDRMVPIVSKSDVHRNDAPITRSLRNKALQNNNNMLEETHVVKKLEKKRQPRGRAISRHRPFASSVEEKEQAVVPCKSTPLLENARGDGFQNGKCEDVGKRPPVRRSTRNRVVTG